MGKTNIPHCASLTSICKLLDDTVNRVDEGTFSEARSKCVFYHSTFPLIRPDKIVKYEIFYLNNCFFILEGNILAILHS